MNSMQCHIHTHKKLHSAMLAVWRKMIFAQESGVEKQLRNQNRTQSTSSLVAAKKTPHTAKRKEQVSCLQARCGSVMKSLCSTTNTPQHRNILQHRLCGEKPQCHIETDAKTNADDVKQRGFQAVMWQIKKNPHTTKKKQKIKHTVTKAGLASVGPGDSLRGEKGER